MGSRCTIPATFLLNHLLTKKKKQKALWGLLIELKVKSKLLSIADNGQCDIALRDLAGLGLISPLWPHWPLGKAQGPCSWVPSFQNVLPLSLQAKSFSFFISQLKRHLLQEATLGTMRCVPPDTLHHSAFTACTEFLPVHQSLWSWSPAHSWLLREIVLTCSQPQPSHLAGRRSLYKSDGRRGHSHLSNCADLLASSLPVPPPCLQERQPFLSPPKPWSFHSLVRLLFIPCALYPEAPSTQPLLSWVCELTPSQRLLLCDYSDSVPHCSACSSLYN